MNGGVRGCEPPEISLAAEAEKLIERYPPGRSRSALVPLLHLVQERDGYVTEKGMNEVAEILEITSAQVRSVATFYTMFHFKPKGRHVISMCQNIACSLNGAEKLIDSLEEHLGIKCGETTGDGQFTLERVECLAACDLAPMLQIDYQAMHGPLSGDAAVALLESATAND